MISIIAAVAENGVIGSGNAMPWHISEDFRRFKAITMGHPIVMGRKTFESLGRPLPGRTNVVITHDPAYGVPEGVLVIGSLDEAVALFSADEEVFIIGGGEIYRQAMSMADKLYITRVCAPFDGDTTFPEISADEWRVVSCEAHERGEKFAHPFEFVDYTRV
ncbi:MAG: dihydrofolate reductase [Rikenellaceae bacterium]|nr:dihydrofolate reductase [Rikenellaceae bacterium]MCL2693151.1 dihydrofolate reductase [Rikenellaceae bacterium]